MTVMVEIIECEQRIAECDKFFRLAKEPINSSHIPGVLSAAIYEAQWRELQQRAMPTVSGLRARAVERLKALTQPTEAGGSHAD